MAAGFNWDEEKVDFDFGEQESSATRVGIIAWTDIQEMFAYVLPVPVVTGGVQTAGVGIAMPEFSWLRASTIHVEPMVNKHNNTSTQDFDSLASFPNARVTIKYITPKYSTFGLPDVSGQPLNPDPVAVLEHRWSIGAEFLTVKPSSELNWFINSADPIPDDLQIGKLIPTIEHQITWPRVINPPFTSIRACVGKLNNASTTFQTGTIDEGTLLFLGADLEREILTNGDRAWKLTYRFSERLIQQEGGAIKGWNVLWNPISAEFDSLELPGGVSNSFPYERADFTALFQAQQGG